MSLISVPYAGGSSLMYKEFEQYLGGVRVEAIDLPGKGRRICEAPCSTFDEAVGDTVKSILEIEDYPSQSLFGYSMGGLLVYESVKRIYEMSNILPKSVFIAACDPPCVCEIEGNFAEWDDGELCDYLIETDGITKELLQEKEFLEFFLPIIRNDFALFDGYEPDPVVTQLPISFNILYSSDEKDITDWEKYTTKACRFQYFEGGHFFIKQNVENVCMLVSQIMDES